MKNGNRRRSIAAVPTDQPIDVPGSANLYANSGPQLRFDHRHNVGLVPYYSIIQ